MILKIVFDIILYLIVSFGFAVFVGKFIAVGEQDN